VDLYQLTVITCHPHAVVMNLQFAFRQGNLLSSPRVGWSPSGGRLVWDLYCETGIRTERMLNVETCHLEHNHCEV
jgi:hypothetical protein